jgi:hypothetical protein
VARIGGNVRVDGRLLSLRHTPRPLFVATSGVERASGEVEVVLEEAAEIL